MGNEIKKNNYRVLIPINKCTLCDITAKETNSSFIEVDHKDKDHNNNDKSNLWALCKFCHNMKSKYENHTDEGSPDIKEWFLNFRAFDNRAGGLICSYNSERKEL